MSALAAFLTTAKEKRLVKAPMRRSPLLANRSQVSVSSIFVSLEVSIAQDLGDPAAVPHSTLELSSLVGLLSGLSSNFLKGNFEDLQFASEGPRGQKAIVRGVSAPSTHCLCVGYDWDSSVSAQQL